MEQKSVRIDKSELDLISEVVDKYDNLFLIKQINDLKYILIFDTNDKVIEFDELIKNKLIYKGFDSNYSPNQFGNMCENMIDKLHFIINENGDV